MLPVWRDCAVDRLLQPTGWIACPESSTAKICPDGCKSFLPYLEQPAGREIAHKFIRAAREAERRWVRPLGARGKQIENLATDIAYLHAIDVWRNKNHQQCIAFHPGAIAAAIFKHRTNIVGAAQEDGTR